MTYAAVIEAERTIGKLLFLAGHNSLKRFEITGINRRIDFR